MSGKNHTRAIAALSALALIGTVPACKKNKDDNTGLLALLGISAVAAADAAAAANNRTVVATMSKEDVATPANSRYSTFAYSADGHTVTITMYKGSHTATGGTLYGTETLTYDTTNHGLTSVAHDDASGTTNDYFITCTNNAAGKPISCSKYTGGTTASATLANTYTMEYDASGNNTCSLTANASGTTTSLIVSTFTASAEISTYAAYSSGTCASPGTVTGTNIYAYDGSGRETCMHLGASPGLFGNFDAHNNPTTLTHYSSGSCASPGSVTATLSAEYTYVGSNLTCATSFYGPVLTIGYDAAGLTNAFGYYAAGGTCSSPSGNPINTAITTTTINTSNSAVDVNAASATKTSYGFNFLVNLAGVAVQARVFGLYTGTVASFGATAVSVYAP